MSDRCAIAAQATHGAPRLAGVEVRARRLDRPLSSARCVIHPATSAQSSRTLSLATPMPVQCSGWRSISNGPLQRWDGEVEPSRCHSQEARRAPGARAARTPRATQRLQHAHARRPIRPAVRDDGDRAQPRKRLAHGRPGVASRNAVRCMVAAVHSRRLSTSSIIEASASAPTYRVRSTTVRGGLVTRMPSGASHDFVVEDRAQSDTPAPSVPGTDGWRRCEHVDQSIAW